MELPFFKYQGTGNDFVMIDNRQHILSKNDTKIIKRLCDRKFGIGADGLILLQNSDQKNEDFKMVYFNADGNEASMCGNGGRCIVAFANFLGIIDGKTSFSAIDGFHEAVFENGLVSLKMMNVEEINIYENHIFLNTGSPHHIIFKDNIANTDVKIEGAAIRFSEAYKNMGGTNVNFVEKLNDTTFKVRTYERGVENETLSCGTGVTAVALAAFLSEKTNKNSVHIETMGGELKVAFKKENNGFKNIWLTGPAKQVFKGTISC